MTDHDDMKDRGDDTAAAQVTMIERVLKEKGDQMDPEQKSAYLAQLTSARGQLKSAEDRTEANKRMGNESQER